MSLESYAEKRKKEREKLKAERSCFEACVLDQLLTAWSKETGVDIGSHKWLWDDSPVVTPEYKGD